MKIDQLMLLLTIIATVCIHPVASQDLSSQSALDKEYVWHTAKTPIDAEKLVEEGSLAMLLEKNGLAIVDLDGRETRTSLDIPSGNWARLSLAPDADGEIEIFCLYPTGTITSLITARVLKGKSYKAWYHAGLEGDYELWYTILGSKSNSVKFLVLESQLQDSISPSGPVGSPGSGASAVSGTTAVAYSIAPSASLAASPGIGFSTGGAKDINNFRENIKQNYLPLPTDVTYEGLFYDYYFDTGEAQECKKLFCPSYSYAVSLDPISGEPQYYLSVGLNSGVTNFQRKKLNLVVVQDFSGSMGSSFDDYYYDRFGNRVEHRVEPKVEDSSKTKMQIADESVVALLGHLLPDDRFGLVVFSDNAFLVDPLTSIGDKDLERLKSRILRIKETDGTNMEAGMEEGTALFDRFLPAGKSEYENRIIFLTDAMPNLGETGELGLFRMFEDNADRGIYTTFIGVGVDFNTELVESITKIKGANYYSVHSPREFKKRMDDEFDYMVTPLVFDLRLRLDAPGYEIEKVYGSPEADGATGELMKVNTLFPSKSEEGQVKGGVILVKLKKLSSVGSLRLLASYQDRNGVQDSDKAEVNVGEVNNGEAKDDFYQNNGIRKAILLANYADLLKNWMMDERAAAKSGWKVIPSVTLDSGIVIPVELGEWERQSMPLTVSDSYRELFVIFEDYFHKEMQAIADDTLVREEDILKKLGSYQGPKFWKGEP